MDNLWAPWRMEFILDKRLKEGGGPCVFCELSKATPNDQNLVLARGKENYVVMNRFPYTNGHLLIVPYQHLAELKDLSQKSHQEICFLASQSMQLLREALKAEGFNCGINVGRVSGCGILDHFHFHVVPRWTGDTNFLPVLSESRSMPEYLSETYQRLEKYFKKMGDSL